MEYLQCNRQCRYTLASSSSALDFQSVLQVSQLVSLSELLETLVSAARLNSAERLLYNDATTADVMTRPRLFVGMILILIFAEVLGLYGLIVALVSFHISASWNSLTQPTDLEHASNRDACMHVIALVQHCA